jgi:porin
MASEWRESAVKRFLIGCSSTFVFYRYPQVDWSPADVNRNNTMATAGFRFNEPLPLRIHNTMSLDYVRSGLSPQFLPPNTAPWKAEQGFEFNMLLDPAPMLLIQPVIQFYSNACGKRQRDVVLGFRIKVEL